METRQYYSSRQVIDVDTFLSEMGTSYIMCVTKAQLHALRVMAKTRLLWPTTWAKERYEQSYSLPEGQDWDAIDNHISKWIAESETVEMCNEALIEALNGIASNIRLASCCWEGGPGLMDIDGTPYYGSQTPLSEPTAFGVGEEFATEEEYNAHKCETANAIVDSMILTLDGLGGLTFANLAAATVLAIVVGLGLVFVPPIGVITAILVAGLAFGFFVDMANEVSDNKEALVCSLYNATDAIDAYDDFKGTMESLAVDIGVAEVQLSSVSALIMQIAPVDTMNALFSAVGLPEVPGTPVDCSESCNPCDEVTVYWGTFDAETGIATSEFNDEPEPDRYETFLHFNYDGAEYCGPELNGFTVTENNPPKPETSGDTGHRCWNQLGEIVYSSNTPPVDVDGVAFYNAVDDTGNFGVTVTWDEV